MRAGTCASLTPSGLLCLVNVMTQAVQWPHRAFKDVIDRKTKLRHHRGCTRLTLLSAGQVSCASNYILVLGARLRPHAAAISRICTLCSPNDLVLPSNERPACDHLISLHVRLALSALQFCEALLAEGVCLCATAVAASVCSSSSLATMLKQRCKAVSRSSQILHSPCANVQAR